MNCCRLYNGQRCATPFHRRTALRAFADTSSRTRHHQLHLRSGPTPRCCAAIQSDPIRSAGLCSGLGLGSGVWGLGLGLVLVLVLGLSSLSSGGQARPELATRQCPISDSISISSGLFSILAVVLSIAP